jgi:hypothetical protein
MLHTVINRQGLGRAFDTVGQRVNQRLTGTPQLLRYIGLATLALFVAATLWVRPVRHRTGAA